MDDDTSLVIINEEGSRLTSAVGATYSYDRRNSVVDPTAGFILTANQDFAGLGGDTTYSKTRGTARVYSSLFDENVILSAELEGGAIFSNDGTRITDRFSSGGDSFRGFARNGIGPRDHCEEGTCIPAFQSDTEVDEALGAISTASCASMRASRWACRRNTGSSGGLFADVGSLWGLDDTDGSMGEVDDSMKMRSSVGVSLFVDTPLAPLRFNYAVPLQKEDYDVTERFRFTVQTRF